MYLLGHSLHSLSGSIAIHEAHCQGNLLHSDISAGNLMVTADGRGVLTDWNCGFFAGMKSARRAVRLLSLLYWYGAASNRDFG